MLWGSTYSLLHFSYEMMDQYSELSNRTISVTGLMIFSLLLIFVFPEFLQGSFLILCCGKQGEWVFSLEMLMTRHLCL